MENKAISRHFNLPGLGQVWVEVWREPSVFGESPAWHCMVRTREAETSPYRDVLYLIEEDLNQVAKEVKSLLPHRCSGCAGEEPPAP